MQDYLQCNGYTYHSEVSFGTYNNVNWNAFNCQAGEYPCVVTGYESNAWMKVSCFATADKLEAKKKFSDAF